MMDAIQFGRWLQNCRRKCGFPSQRSLAEAVQRDRALAETGISEAFLARLEAGLLVHPFRGKVREQVLILAKLLCKTPRELTAYLRAAELTDLDAGQRAHVEQLRRRLSPQQQQQLLPLPPRPLRLFGRQSIVEELRERVCALDTGSYLITGMPGVGKSALAAEIVHQLAHHEPKGIRGFSDGVAAFRCRGYRGKDGLLNLLEDIVAAFGPSAPPAQGADPPTAAHDVDVALTRIMTKVRLVLANMSVLLLLDNVEAAFPLHEALEAILSQDHTPGWEGVKRPPHRVVLATSSYRFAPTTIRHHLHLKPLEPDDALAYFTSLLDHPLPPEEWEHTQELCAAVGSLPLAIEGLVSLYTDGVPPGLLCTTLLENPGGALLDNTQKLRARLEGELDALDAGAQRSFALLAALGVTSFRLEGAAALSTGASRHLDPQPVDHPWPVISAMDEGEETRPQLVQTALELGRLVRHSLIELAPANAEMTETFGSTSNKDERRYMLHPVLRTYALERLNTLEPAEIEAARGNSLAYALRYLEQHKAHNTRLLAERDFLFASFKDALRTEQYAESVRFVDALASISCRLRRREDGTHLFLWGIQACQRLHNRSLELKFMHCLGILYCLQGAFADARQVWEEALAINASLDRPLQNWQPLLQLANLSHLQGEEEAAIHSVETYLRYSQDSASPLNQVLARAHLALYKRLQGKREDAYIQISSGLDLLSTYAISEAPSSIATVQDYIALQIQTERARIQEDYPASQRYTRAIATFLRAEEEPYELAEVLSEQASFALQQAKWEDMEALASALRQAAAEVKASYFHQRSLYLFRVAENAHVS